jgi:putative SOS response-associated peptidase YedK
MCGRARLANDYSEIKIRLRFDASAPAPNLRPSWNIPPTGDMLVATYTADGKRISEIMRWGLVPSWAKDIKIGYSTFNARADTVTSKPGFRSAWKHGRRCLVVTDGFYEWRKSDKQPFAIGMADDDVMVMAGLWEEWTSPAGERVKSCTVITCEPNEIVGTLHDRMPVILEEKDWPKWLGEEPASEDELKALLTPCASERMKMWPVDKRVGNVRNNGGELVQPVQDLVAMMHEVARGAWEM